MIQSAPVEGVDESELRAQFEAELERLVQVEQTRGAVAAVVRLRALADISNHLSTDVLVALSAAVCMTQITAARLENIAGARPH